MRGCVYVCAERGEREGERLGDRNAGKRCSLGRGQGSFWRWQPLLILFPSQILNKHQPLCGQGTLTAFRNTKSVTAPGGLQLTSNQLNS